MQTFAEYLANLRAQVLTGFGSSDTPTNSAVLALVQIEYLKRHEAAVFYEYLGDDSNGAPVYRLGTAILLVDIQTQLTALVTAKSVHRYGQGMNAYSCNPSLTNP